jgi:hypothetical protein
MILSILAAAINTLNDILSIKPPPNLGTIPPPIVVLSKTRGGMSSLRAANKVLEKKKELGLPTGNLADGSANFDDILWYTAIKAIIDEITNEAKITSASLPGTQIAASGTDAEGMPVVVYGSTITFADGGTIIE